MDIAAKRYQKVIPQTSKKVVVCNTKANSGLKKINEANFINNGLKCGEIKE